MEEAQGYKGGVRHPSWGEGLGLQGEDLGKISSFIGAPLLP